MYARLTDTNGMEGEHKVSDFNWRLERRELVKETDSSGQVKETTRGIADPDHGRQLPARPCRRRWPAPHSYRRRLASPAPAQRTQQDRQYDVCMLGLTLIHSIWFHLICPSTAFRVSTYNQKEEFPSAFSSIHLIFSFDLAISVQIRRRWI